MKVLDGRTGFVIEVLWRMGYGKIKGERSRALTCADLLGKM
jgi:hypothetical protein